MPTIPTRVRGKAAIADSCLKLRPIDPVLYQSLKKRPATVDAIRMELKRDPQAGVEWWPDTLRVDLLQSAPLWRSGFNSPTIRKHDRPMLFSRGWMAQATGRVRLKPVMERCLSSYRMTSKPAITLASRSSTVMTGAPLGATSMISSVANSCSFK